VHCLNALLQGHYFSEVDLMTIARELDEVEQEAMMVGGTDTKEFLKFMAVRTISSVIVTFEGGKW
jgi:ataxin-3